MHMISDVSMFVTVIFRSLDPRFLNWLNSLFYLPPEGELRVRKEYRMLTDQERNNFHNAIRLLKQDTVSTTVCYTRLHETKSRRIMLLKKKVSNLKSHFLITLSFCSSKMEVVTIKFTFLRSNRLKI